MASDKTQLIERLLAKAESTTPEEAEALTEAAAKLMARHGVTQAMIEAKREAGAEREKIVQEEIPFTGVHSAGLLQMGAIVTQALGTVRLVQRRGRKATDKTLVLMGYESDVSQLKLMIESLHLQAIVAMRSWWRGLEDRRWYTQAEGNMAKRGFLMAFGRGAAAKLKSAMTEATAEAGTGTELALLDRSAQVADAFGEAFPSLRRGRRLKASNAGAGAGYEAGSTANVGGKTLAGATAGALSR